MKKRTGIHRITLYVSIMLILSAAVFLFAGCGGGKLINASSLLSIEFTGLDGDGTIVLTFDRDGLKQLLSEKESLTERQIEMVDSLPGDIYKDFSVSKREGISNGDEIEITGAVDNDLLKDLGYAVKNDTIKVTVTGLKEAERIDLAAAVDITFEGIAPNVKVLFNVDYDLPYVQYTSLFYSTSSEYVHLNNGDTYTLNITYNEERLREEGYIVENATVTKVVEGLSSIDFELTGFSDPLLEEMLRESQEEVAKYAISNYSQLQYSMLGDRQGWVLWDEMRTEAVEMKEVKNKEKTDNCLYLIYNLAVPVRLPDGNIESGKLVLVMERGGVALTPEGTLYSEQSWKANSFASREEADNYIYLQMEYYFDETPYVTEFSGETSEEPDYEQLQKHFEPVMADAGKQAIQSVQLNEMIPDFAKNTEVWETMTDPYGNEYQNPLALNAGNAARTDYLLNGEWNRFSFVLSTYNDADTEAQMSMYIWGDDRLLYAADAYQRSDAPQNLSLDVTGVERLSIQTISYGNTYKAWLCINNGVLERTEDIAAPEIMKKAFSDEIISESGEMENKAQSSMSTDVRGDVFRDAYILRADKNGLMRVRLGGKYSHISADVSVAKMPYEFDISGGVVVSVDGEEVLRIEDISLMNPSSKIDLDVTDAEVLEIASFADHEDKSGLFFIVGNTLLSGAPEIITFEEAEPDVYPEIDPGLQSMYIDEDGESDLIILDTVDYRYILVDRDCDYNTAKLTAEQFGGTLIMPKTERQKEVLHILISKSNGYYVSWIGAERAAPGSDIWMWADGEQLSDTELWESGEPDNYYAPENCLCMDYDGELRDENESEEKAFVIQIPSLSWNASERSAFLAELPVLGKEGMEYRRIAKQDTGITGPLDWDEYTSGTIDPLAIELNALNDGRVWYTLDKKYSDLYFDMYVSGDSSVNSRASFAVFGDGKLLYHTNGLKKSDSHRSIHLDVSNVSYLCLKSTETAANEKIGLLIISPRLTPDTELLEYGQGLLTEFKPVDNNYAETSLKLEYDSQGNPHPGWVKMDSANNGFIMYNLGGYFNTLTGKLCTGNDTSVSGNASLSIYIDGELAETIENVKAGDHGREFSLDVTGASTVRFETSCTGEAMNNYIYLTDLVVKYG